MKPHPEPVAEGEGISSESGGFRNAAGSTESPPAGSRRILTAIGLFFTFSPEKPNLFIRHSSLLPPVPASRSHNAKHRAKPCQMEDYKG